MSSDLLAFIRWWLIVEVFGLVGLPLAFRLLRWLPDRGYALAKPLGLLLSGYVFWLLASLGFMRNTAGGVVAAMALTLAAGLWWHSRHPVPGFSPVGDGIRAWLRTHLGLVLATEGLFLLAFAFWAYFKAYNPDIAATEKPMEFAFLNAILRSPTFPPLDPWMSGFAISYYYFGYVIVSMLIRLSGVPSAVGFNLAIALLFALTATGGFGVVYNLVASAMKPRNVEEPKETQPGPKASPLLMPIAFGLLGALLLVGVGNWEGTLEVLHNQGVGSAAFWQWLDIQEINVPPPEQPSWPPRGGWWWWRASRVIHDYGPDGSSDQEAIDEFPFFSFLLGDMHPHVLALPFVLLALGLGLNLFLRTACTSEDRPEGGEALSLNAVLRRVLRLGGLDLLVYAVVLGGLAFLNTWDFPITWFVVIGGYTLARLTSSPAPPLGEKGVKEPGQFDRWLVADVIGLGTLLGLAGVLLYLPFYIGFQTQASGLLPTVYNVTRLPQYLVMFGVFLVPISILVVVLAADAARAGRLSLRAILAAGGVILGVLLALLLFAAVLAVRAPQAQEFIQQAGGVGSIAARFAALRVRNPWLLLTLLSLISLVIGLIRAGLNPVDPSTPNRQGTARRPSPRVAQGRLSLAHRPSGQLEWPPVVLFGLLLVGAGALLTLAPDFVYIRDNFGYRINTVFKFYYQGWVLYAVAAAFAIYLAGQRLQGVGRLMFGLATAVSLFMALVYPVKAIPDRAGNFASEPTLNGLAFFEKLHPDYMEAIRWMQAREPGAPVVLEAVRPSYDPQFAGPYFSQHAGYPTVLGWPFHEVQWRGTAEKLGSREQDVRTIYQSSNWKEVVELLKRYKVAYIVVGPVEQGTYGPGGLGKFRVNLGEPVFQQGQVALYQVPSTLGE